MTRGFLSTFGVSAGLSVVAASVVIIAAGGGEFGDPRFVLAWSAIYGFPFLVLVALPIAWRAWQERWRSGVVFGMGVIVGALPGLLQYFAGRPFSAGPSLAGTGSPLLLVASTLAGAVGTVSFLALGRLQRDRA